MSKNYILTLTILLFFIVNIFSLKAFSFNAYWDILYDKNDFESAIKYYEVAWNKEWIYNKANALYKQKKYTESIKEYMSLVTNDENIYDFRLNHNIANNYYRLWELEKDSSKKIQNWEKSIEYYRNALNIKYDEETKKNMEFVLKKIEEEKKKEQEKDKKKDDENKTGSWSEDKSWKSEQNKTGSWSEDKSWKWEQNKTGSWGEDKSWKQQSKDSSNQGKEKQWENLSWSKPEKNNLSKEQSKALQEYQESLKQEQKNNSNSFNKVYQGNNPGDPFNVFNDPFFDNDLLNWWNNKKDW